MAAIILEYICSQEMLEGTTETEKLAIGVVLDCCILVCKVNVMVCGPLCEPQLHRLNVTSRGLKVFADQHVHVVAVYSHLGAVTNTPVYCMFVNTKFIFCGECPPPFFLTEARFYGYILIFLRLVNFSLSLFWRKYSYDTTHAKEYTCNLLFVSFVFVQRCS